MNARLSQEFWKAVSPMTVRVSVLDTAPIVQGSTARTAITNTLHLAELADQLGYHRYWVPEHHSMRGVASSAPEVLIARIAGITERLRVGAGGVLLPNHAPLVVAEQFGTLEALYPGRIDLGLGRAPGGPPAATRAVQRQQTQPEHPFADQLSELLSYLDGHTEQPVTAVPAVGNRPPVWLLGSTPASAALAAARGLPYAVAHHLKPEHATKAAALYRDRFQPSKWCSQPTTLLSVSVIAADTDARAQWLAGSTRLKRLSRHHGRHVLLPPPEDAEAYSYTNEDRAEIAARTTSVVVGSPSTVTDRLHTLLTETGTNELMVTTPIYHHQDRLHSYSLISEIATTLNADHRAVRARWGSS